MSKHPMTRGLTRERIEKCSSQGKSRGINTTIKLLYNCILNSQIYIFSYKKLCCCWILYTNCGI